MKIQGVRGLIAPRTGKGANMAAKGYIKIYRQLVDNAIWLSTEPFDKRAAWIDLLLMANHAEKSIIVNNQLLTIKRGQTFTSMQKLADRWHWSRKRTYSYIKLLETSGMVYRTTMLNGTLLTLVKYVAFQGQGNTTDTTEVTTGVTTGVPTTDTQTRMKKNDIKNDLRRKRISPPAIEDF